VSLNVASWPAKAGRLWLREMRHLLPPTLYFFCAFNIIIHTTNLLTRNYWFALSHFLTATLFALLVGKAVLVANKIRGIDRFRGAPLIKPILFKTVFYVLVVTVFRVAEQFIHFSFDSDGFRIAFQEAADAFSWRRFTAIEIWLFTCFLIYVAVAELSAALGPGKLRRLMFGPRD
jgi:hypothetical protein